MINDYDGYTDEQKYMLHHWILHYTPLNHDQL